MSTLAITIHLDPEQFVEADSIEFFHKALIGKVARVDIDGYSFGGYVEGTVTR